MTQLSLDELTPSVKSQWITARNGKRRQIYVPNDPMRSLHARVIRSIRDQIEEMPAAHGSVPGGSAVRHASRHQGSCYVYKLDLYNAFPSTQLDWVAPLLLQVKTDLWIDATSVERFLRDCVMLPGGNGLMTGTPASPDLFNRVAAERLDVPLIELANKEVVQYTRYLDDLVFSSYRPISNRVRRNIREVIRASGFRLNFQKTDYYDISRQPVMITGIRLGCGPSSQWPGEFSIYVPRKWLTRLEGVLYCYARGDDIAPEYIEGLMGVMREVCAHSQNYLSRHQARVWGTYLAVRPFLRPHAPLSPMEEGWKYAFQMYMKFGHDGRLREEPLKGITVRREPYGRL